VLQGTPIYRPTAINLPSHHEGSLPLPLRGRPVNVLLYSNDEPEISVQTPLTPKSAKLLDRAKLTIDLCSHRVQFLALDTLPFNPNNSENRHTCHSDGYVPRLCQRMIVSYLHSCEETRWDVCLQIGGATVHDDAWVDAWNCCNDALKKFIGEDVLGDG